MLSLLLAVVVLLPSNIAAAESIDKNQAAADTVRNGDTENASALGNRIINLRQKKIKRNGREVLRIELEMAKNTAQYTVSTKPYLKKQVIVSFPDTKLASRVTGEFSSASGLVSLITVSEGAKGRAGATVTINMTGQILRGSYDVYTIPGNTQKKQPTRRSRKQRRTALPRRAV